MCKVKNIDTKFNEAMDFINSFGKYGKKVEDLSRVKELLSALGNPQDDLEFIHIAGTNGKGSVSQMCSEALLLSGVKTGLYTSPFILEYRDRINYMGEMIPKADLIKITNKVKGIVDTIPNKCDFSGFEITMSIALMYYKSVGCEVVVFETGLGGLLDCTNVIKSPLVSIITSISHDHMAVLGDTLEKIAIQKAGIIKENCPCVLSFDNESEVISVIKKTADKKHSKFILPEKSDLEILSNKLLDTSFIYKGEKYSLNMFGTHQITNAVSAIEALSLLPSKYNLSKDTVKKGIEKAFVIGRTEVLSKEPFILLDGSHNDGGMKALSKLLSGVNAKTTAIFGSLKGKQIDKSLLNIIDNIDEFIVVDDFDEMSIERNEVESILKSMNKKVTLGESTKKEYQKALNGEYENTVIFGTLYLVSYIKNLDVSSQ